MSSGSEHIDTERELISGLRDDFLYMAHRITGMSSDEPIPLPQGRNQPQRYLEIEEHMVSSLVAKIGMRNLAGAYEEAATIIQNYGYSPVQVVDRALKSDTTQWSQRTGISKSNANIAEYRRKKKIGRPEDILLNPMGFDRKANSILEGHGIDISQIRVNLPTNEGFVEKTIDRSIGYAQLTEALLNALDGFGLVLDDELSIPQKLSRRR